MYMTNMNWIVDWDLIDRDKRYLVCQIDSYPPERGLSLGRPEFHPGWRIQDTLRRNCYVAIELPEFDPMLVPWYREMKTTAKEMT